MDKLLYINGEWMGSELEKINVTNPATGEIVGTVPNAGVKETREAIDAAYSAFLEWSTLTAYERAEYLEKLYEMMVENKDKLAKLITIEMGKPLSESKGEVQYAAEFLKWFAEEGKRVYGRTVPSHTKDKRMMLIKQPVGVVAAITPWNFPAAMITRKLGPALAAGCTFILKPAEETPLTALMLAMLCEKVGIPKGVVNVITGQPVQIGEEFMANPKVSKITFTGSTAVGKLLIKQSAEQVKKISMELGGHAPIIILDDANVEKAVKGVLLSKFRNGGQTCICGNRIYVQEGIYDDFIQKFIKAVETLKVGNGLEEGIEVGPIINKSGYDKINMHVQDALNRGATCLLGGKGEQQDNAYFYYPTILADVTKEMIIMNEETFGPVAPIQKIASDEEAIHYANDTMYGLAAYVFTENYSRGLNVVESLNYGIVGWNDGVPSAPQAPFGGMKQSGIGREGGIEGIEEYLETKYVSIGS
ncbi:succinate-semialdehyde dehydrogenase (NADP(+)) [Pueribacillus theae]|uniref:Succinate-semialdehyde dehydrogenase (NADP(+)) n=1 Tax=Pueribacillus theae TaxID=2171751 RepID=A0A2U1JYS3_9BACI|nr:NAD-dependent succinate-semialdehyde dehydrogenase [Pueribacillus theae]PWA10376.1 succinate-semialdehyde dehydrogenase (NADP(+)) [Pueribacillus theae]